MILSLNDNLIKEIKVFGNNFDHTFAKWIDCFTSANFDYNLRTNIFWIDENNQLGIS